MVNIKMNVTLQKHGAKHIYKVPEGLRELCTDISREVLRSQPENLYAFIAEYVDTLLITRENTKVAVKVVNNILLGSQAILCILYRAGFTLEQIAVAAPRIQKAFREYLDTVDMQPTQICTDETCEEVSMTSIRNILESTGVSREEAERAATIIQAAFRGHYERMALNEAQGKVQWQRAVANTLDILKKAGATQDEIAKAAGYVKFAYRGYYTRRNQRIDAPGMEAKPLKKDERILEPVEAIQAVAWMEMMYRDSGLTLDKANEAASIIQRAYKKYRGRRRCYDVQQFESSKTMVAEAIVDSLHRQIFSKVASRENVPTEFGTREEMIRQTSKLQMVFKERIRMECLTKKGHSEYSEFEEGEEEDGEEAEEGADTVVIPTPPAKPKYRPIEERLPKESLVREELPSESEATTEQLITNTDVQSETEPPTETEFEDVTEDEQTSKRYTKDEDHPEAADEGEDEEEAKEDRKMDTDDGEVAGQKDTQTEGETTETEEETKATPETGDGAAQE